MKNKRQKDVTKSKRQSSGGQKSKQVTGTLSLSYRGIGSVIDQEKKRKIVIYPEYLLGALQGDTVSVEIYEGQNRDFPKGKITKIESRAKYGFTGTLVDRDGVLFVVPNDKRIYLPIILKEKPSKRITEAIGKKVFASEVAYEKQSILATKIEILGNVGEHNTEIESIVLDQGFTIGFPKEVLDETKGIHEPRGKDYEDRRDLRNTPTFTIDPVDAKDFDDAISFQKKENGLYEIGIHIADVSYYVRPGTLLDKEAYKRATSVYLVDRTIPMLPERLSNDVCSLKPNVDRLTMSVVVTITEKAEIKDVWYGRTVIHSQKRFTYEEAQQTLEDKTGFWYEALETCNNIAKILRHKREEKGSLDFPTEEIRCILNDQNEVEKFVKKKRVDAHKLIEEYMLLANQLVASLWNPRHLKKDFEMFLYRVHDIPNQEKIDLVRSLATSLGYTFPEKKKATQREIQKFINQIKGTPHETFLGTLLVRSMAKAIYSTRPIGHYGLALEDYAHFTSPIRRYPDIVVHRFLTEYLGKKSRKHDKKTFERIAEHTSMMEKNAAQAERDSLTYKQIEYMARHIDKTFRGTISGVIERGVFVSEEESGSEGMIAQEHLGEPNTWRFNESTYELTNDVTKERLRIGDHLCFRVSEALPLERKLEYIRIICTHTSKK